MARTMRRRVSASLLTLAAAALAAFSGAGRCSAQSTADRHTLRYDGEVNIGETGRQTCRLEAEDRSSDRSTDFLAIEFSCEAFEFRRL